jgi:hypothetical protein
MELMTIRRSGPSRTIRGDRQHGPLPMCRAVNTCSSCQVRYSPTTTGMGVQETGRSFLSPLTEPDGFTVIQIPRGLQRCWARAGREASFLATLNISGIGNVTVCLLRTASTQAPARESIFLPHCPVSLGVRVLGAPSSVQQFVLFFDPRQVVLQAQHQPPHLRPRRPPIPSFLQARLDLRAQ